MGLRTVQRYCAACDKSHIAKIRRLKTTKTLTQKHCSELLFSTAADGAATQWTSTSPVSELVGHVTRWSVDVVMTSRWFLRHEETHLAAVGGTAAGSSSTSARGMTSLVSTLSSSLLSASDGHLLSCIKLLPWAAILWSTQLAEIFTIEATARDLIEILKIIKYIRQR